MKNVSLAFVLVLLLLMAATVSVAAQPVRIVAPYLGIASNRLKQELDGGQDIDLEDTDLMMGLYLQWINHRFFQVNGFIYHAPTITYSRLWGLHLNADYYLLPTDLGKAVVGGGYERIWLDMDAGRNVDDSLDDFTLTNDISVPFFRAGYSFRLGTDRTSVSLFPWAGVQIEQVSGEVSFSTDPNGPFPPPRQDIEDDFDDIDASALFGLNTRLFAFRFLQGTAKYRVALGNEEPRHTATAMVNVFFNRHFGLSYRARYGESSAGTDIYHLFGVAYSF